MNDFLGGWWVEVTTILRLAATSATHVKMLANKTIAAFGYSMSDISKKFYGAFTKWIDVVLCHS
jgi:hypothetical protein